jgi:hypothetical protein
LAPASLITIWWVIDNWFTILIILSFPSIPFDFLNQQFCVVFFLSDVICVQKKLKSITDCYCQETWNVDFQLIIKYYFS